MNKHQSCKGFSLLEITISLTIIALLIAAITAGQSVKHRSELNSVMDDITTINSANTNFRDTYGSMAGDVFNAETLFGETNVGNKVADGDLEGNGNGNNKLEDDLTSPTRNEKLLFWQDLAAAGLISGTYDGATIGEAGMYASQLKDIYYYPETDSDNNDVLYFLASRVISGDAGNGAFTTKETFDYDTKYDNGIPNSGIIRTEDGIDQDAGACITDNDYNLTYTGNYACVIKFYTE